MREGQTLSLVLVIAYGILCSSAFAQVCRILYYAHSLLSFQFSFLVLAVLWGASRIAFYLVTGLEFKSALALYWFPTDIQFATYSLLVLFYVYLLHVRDWERHVKRIAIPCYIVPNLLLVALTTVWLVGGGKQDSLGRGHHLFLACQTLAMVLVFLVYGYKLSTAHHQVINAPANRVVAVTVLVALIFTSRCIYNFLAYADVYSIDIWEYPDSWIKDLEWDGFLTAFVWEVLPTLMVLLYFRHIPRTRYRRCRWWCPAESHTELSPSVSAVNRFPSPMPVGFSRESSYTYDSPRSEDGFGALTPVLARSFLHPNLRADDFDDEADFE